MMFSNENKSTLIFTQVLSFTFVKSAPRCMNCVWSGLCRCLAKPSDSGTRVAAARLRRQGKAGQHRPDSTCSACRGALTREHTTATQATHFYRSWVPLTQDQAGTQLGTWRRQRRGGVAAVSWCAAAAATVTYIEGILLLARCKRENPIGQFSFLRLHFILLLPSR